jgi:mannose-6-phosphate isomerase-like protein (cupin superfamily)
MRYRRLYFIGLFVVLAPAIGVTQLQPNAAADKPAVLHSRVYHFEDLKARPHGGVKYTAVLDGITTRGERLGLHESELVPGAEANPAHAHHNEEIIVVREGTLQVAINGTPANLGPGSVAYVQSDDVYGLKLVGSTPAKYIVISIGDR